jgi:hypothetical protein
VLIALLIVLGIELIVIVAFVGLVVGRRRWLNQQPGEFAGAIRLTSGDVGGLSPKWKRGSGRWVRDVLVWNRAPLLLFSQLVPVDQFSGERQGSNEDLNRLGDKPAVAEFVCESATFEVATKVERLALVIGPWSTRAIPNPPSK